MNEDDDKSPDSVLRISFINLHISGQNNFQSNHSKLNQLKHIYIYIFIITFYSFLLFLFEKRRGIYVSPLLRFGLNAAINYRNWESGGKG